MPFSLVRNDIAHITAEALVAPSNEQLVIDGGAGLSIAMALGCSQLQLACQKLAPVETGSVTAVAVDWAESPTRYVLNAVGPVWGSDISGQKALLAQVYRNVFHSALDLGVSSVAVPLLSTGVRGCPAQVSFDVAFEELQRFLQENDTDLLITVVLFGGDAVAAASRYVADIRQVIHDDYASRMASREARESRPLFCASQASAPYAPAPAPQRQEKPGFFQRAAEAIHGRVDALKPSESRKEQRETPSVSGSSAPNWEECAPQPMMAPFEESCYGNNQAYSSSLEYALSSMDASFSETLLNLIELKGLTDAEAYKRANVSRQHFSKIRSDAHYQPTKKTVLAFCIALELSLDASEDLLARAGFAFSPSASFDVIVRYFIAHKIYDIFEINGTLYEFDQPMLG